MGLVVAAAGCPDRGPLVWKPFTWFGTVSYGVYLWHGALVGFMPGGLVPTFWVRTAEIVFSVGVAALSYYLLELPLLRLKKRFEFRPAVRAAVPAAAAVARPRVPVQREPITARQAAIRAAASRGVVVRRPVVPVDRFSVARGR
jgi:peptidoglycan/LPS O-acetylase OafA/YrhL